MEEKIVNTKERLEKREREKENEKKELVKDMPRPDKGETTIETHKSTYEIKEELGSGSFGAVYKIRRNTDNKLFAMKCESVNSRRPMLGHEASVLLALNLLDSVHFLELIDHGRVNGRFLFVVLKLVGINLWDLRLRQPDKRYTLNTALKIGEQTLAGLRDLHRVGYLHRDIKPPNFAIGREDENTFHTVFVLDFGLCRKMIRKGADLRTPRNSCHFRGTTRYASLAAHEMKEQSRKDDIEAWWYMLAELIAVDIPWRQLRGNDRERVKTSKKMLRDDPKALATLFKDICYEQMKSILSYVDHLTYESIPDYDYVYRQVQSAATSNGFTERTPVDWDNTKMYRGPKYKCGEPYIVKELL